MLAVVAVVEEVEEEEEEILVMVETLVLAVTLAMAAAVGALKLNLPLSCMRCQPLRLVLVQDDSMSAP